MNAGEATDVNTLLGFLLADHDDPEVPDAAAAGEAAARLADRAYRSLGAGWRARDVEQAWPDLDWPGPRTAAPC